MISAKPPRNDGSTAVHSDLHRLASMSGSKFRSIVTTRKDYRGQEYESYSYQMLMGGDHKWGPVLDFDQLWRILASCAGLTNAQA